MGILDDVRSLVGTGQKPTSDSSAMKKVLIIEDDAQLSSALELKFSQAEYLVLKAENGQAGLDLALAQKPDLIVLDLMMPIMDGKTMLKKLAADYPQISNIPVIVLTNAGSVDNMTETKTFPNVKEFLIKSNVTLEQIIGKASQLTAISL